MRRRHRKYALVFLDWIILVGAYAAALKLHTSREFALLSNEFPYVEGEVVFFAIYALVVLLIFEMNQLYRVDVCMSITRQLQYIAKSLSYAVIGIALLSFFTKSKVIVDSRLVMLLSFLVSFMGLALVRVLIFRSVFRFLGFSNLYARTVLIVGTGQAGIRMGKVIAEPNEYHLHLAGYLDDTMPVGSEVFSDVAILGHTKDVEKIVKRHRIAEILFCMEQVSDERFFEVLDLCARTKAMIMVGSDQVTVIPRRLNVESYGEMPVFGVMNGVPAKAMPLLKRVFDPVLAFTALVILSPLFLIAALLIKLDSRGPVLFTHVRVGKNGRPFTFYKFRSMVVGSEQDNERQEKLRHFIGEGKPDKSDTTKIVDDKKITRVGRFIRKTSIDELPQLFNVLKGDMSLVGPRPCLPYEWESYAEWHKRRLSVTPGCTGVWQVLGRSEVGFRDMVILDLFYTYNISFHLDVWLVLKTIPVMLFGTGGK